MADYSLKDIGVFCRQEMELFKSRQLILLEGDLGAGKTTFIQKCLQIYGIHGAESPTFSIINHYDGCPQVYHVDLYRLEEAHDIESTGFWDLFDQEAAVIFVEWSNRVPDRQWPSAWSPRKWTIAPSLKGSEYRQIESFPL